MTHGEEDAFAGSREQIEFSSTIWDCSLVCEGGFLIGSGLVDKTIVPTSIRQGELE
jgi:hypothetical protein